MAINQVINGSDRVVENPNRYKLNAVSGQANVYDLEKQPGAITNVGTPYNKLILDKIDNVLSYLTPSVEKAPTISEKTYIGNIIPTDITPTWENSPHDLGYEITQNLTQFDNLTPIIKYKSNQPFRNYNGMTNNNVCLASRNSSSYPQTSEFFLQESTRTTFSTAYYNIIRFFRNENDYVEILFDFGTKCKPSFKYCMDLEGLDEHKIQESEDGIIWNDIGNVINGGDNIFTPSNKNRYFRLYFHNDATNTNGIFIIYYLYVSEVTYDGEAYQNQFTLDNNGSSEIIGYEEGYEYSNVTKNWSNSGDYIISNSEARVTALDNYLYNAGSYPLVYGFNGDISNRTIIASTSGNVPNKTDLLIDLLEEKIISQIKMNINITSSWETIFEYSLDNINWNNITSIGEHTGEVNILTNDITARYIRLRANSISTANGSISIFDTTITIATPILIPIYSHPFTNNQRVLIETPTMDLDGVTSNTLNGVDIPTLLQPSTKYELIYNESGNKFELGNKPLYDITLTEAVSQVDINELPSLMETGKIYSLIFEKSIGVQYSILGLTSEFTFGSNFCFLKKTVYPLGIGIGFMSASNTTSYIGIATYYNGTAYLKAYNNGTFPAGTRIIIKEVA